jgi:hypothetical protein
VVGGVCRDASLRLMQAYVERHPEDEWLEAMLPRVLLSGRLAAS